MLVCPGGGGDPSGLCLWGLSPSPGAMPGDRAACAPLPAACLLPRGPGFCREGLRVVPDLGPQHTSAALVTPA